MTQNINKFGVQDIWSVFKKNLILILIFSFFSCVIFGFATCKKMINIFKNSNSIENNSQIYKPFKFLKTPPAPLAKKKNAKGHGWTFDASIALKMSQNHVKAEL